MGKWTSKVTVTMEIEVEELDLFMNNIPSGVIEFSKETGANILSVKTKEHDKRGKKNERQKEN